MNPDLAPWVELWHAMKDVVIVGHEPGGPCPYQVGHSFREHFINDRWPAVETRIRSIIEHGLHLEDRQ